MIDNERIEVALAGLSPNEEACARRLLNAEEKSFRALARDLGMSFYKLRQIESLALKKIRVMDLAVGAHLVRMRTRRREKGIEG